MNSLSDENALPRRTAKATPAAEITYRDLFESTRDAVMLLDPRSQKFLSANPSTLILFGYADEEDFCKHKPWQHSPQIQPDGRLSAEKATEMIMTAMRLGSHMFSWTHRRADDSEFQCDVLLTRVARKEGTLLYATVRDVTDRLHAEAARARLASIVESSQDAIVSMDIDRLITSWNAGAERLFGYSTQEVIGRRMSLVVAGEKRAELSWLLGPLMRGEIIEPFESECVTKDGSRIMVTIVLSPIKGRDNEHIGTSAIVRNITEERRIEQDLVRAAHFDSLTGLMNRFSFGEALEQAIEQARLSAKNFAVLSLDIDRFKDVNDTLGHPVGDLLLQQVAQRLRESVRRIDMVARFGGDEFAVIATDLIETPSVSRLAQRIIASLNKPFLINGNEIRCGVSVGIALFSRNVQDVTTLLSRADIALYRAKDDGRGVFRFFTDAMDRDVRERFVLGGELRDAIDAGQLCLQYQPQVDGQNGVLIGMEALVRWQHPARGLIGPNIFIPISEQIGLAVALGRWVMREACRQTREWLDEGLNPPRIAINVSGQQFKTPGEIETDLDLALFDYGLTAERFELELTESVLMDQSLEHFEALLRLTKAGFRLAIDDFGTGYSSLGYLRRFKVNRIKIAQEFVKDIKENLGDLAIVKATIGLAHALNVEVIAEGVETAQHRDLLEQWGCREMQGYYFARPLPPKQIAALLRSGETLPCP